MKTIYIVGGAVTALVIAEQVGEWIQHNRLLKKMPEVLDGSSWNLSDEAKAELAAWLQDDNDTRTFKEFIKPFTMKHVIGE